MRIAETEFEQVKDIHVHVFRGQMPKGGHGLVVAGDPGQFFIMLNSADPEDEQRRAYLHEMLHIFNDDFDRVAVEGASAVEAQVHSLIEQLFPEAV